MSDRTIVGRVVPVQGPSFVPAHERRAAPRRWTVKVARRGRVLRLTLTAPSVAQASLSERQLEAAAWAYVRSQR
jgi:hypothetical protein